MKNIITTLIISFSVYSVSTGQISAPEGKPVKETKTLLGRNNKVRGFASIDANVTELKGKKALLAGIHGGAILNNNFVLGLGGHGITTNVSFQSEDDSEKVFLYGGYGGLLVGGIIAPKEIIHVSFTLLMGAGGVDISNQNYYNSGNSLSSSQRGESSAFFVLEPGIDVEINITKFLKLGVGARYRMVDESELVNISDDELSGYSAGVSFKFGKF